jgi:hypothetical protein
MVQPAKDRMRAERSVLCLKSALRLERRDRQGQEDRQTLAVPILGGLHHQYVAMLVLAVEFRATLGF